MYGTNATITPFGFRAERGSNVLRVWLRWPRVSTEFTAVAERCAHPCILVLSMELFRSPVTRAGCETHGIGTRYRFRWVVPR